MKIPLLDITIYAINALYPEMEVTSSPGYVQLYNKPRLSWKLVKISGEKHDLKPIYSDVEYPFEYFKNLIRWTLRMIQHFGTPFSSKFLSNYTSKLDMDDEGAAEKVYIDYLRVLNQSKEGFEGLYKDLKEVVRPIIITNANLCQAIESDRAFSGNATKYTNNKYSQRVEDVASDGTITTLQHITHEPFDLQTRVRSFDMKSVNGVRVNNNTCTNK